MGTYWQQFIEVYQKQLPHKSMAEILEAFWYYCNGRHKEASDIMAIF
jgi:hypothetical protein